MRQVNHFGMIAVTLVIMASTLLACQTTTPSPVPTVPAAPTTKAATTPNQSGEAKPQVSSSTWKFETPQAKDTRAIVYHEKPFIDFVEKNSGGRIKIEHYFSSGLGFGPPKLLDGLQSGLLDGGQIVMASVAGALPLADVPELPAMVPFDARLRADILETVMLPVWDRELQKRSVMIFNPVQFEPRNIYTKKPVKSLADMKGLKLRTMGVLESDFTTALGGVPVTVNWAELYTALQTGVVDGFWGTHADVDAAKLYEVTRYGFETSISGAVAANVIQKQVFDRLSPDLQKVVRDGAAEGAKTWNANYPELYAKYRQVLKDRGMEINSPNSSDNTETVRAAKSIWAKFAESKGASSGEYKQLIDKIQAKMKP